MNNLTPQELSEIDSFVGQKIEELQYVLSSIHEEYHDVTNPSNDFFEALIRCCDEELVRLGYEDERF